jgi:hypothetical protein
MPTITTVLTDADKLNIVNQHLKGLEFAIYGLELDLIVENAASDPSEDSITSITNRLNSLVLKRTALLAEAATLSE